MSTHANPASHLMGKKRKKVISKENSGEQKVFMQTRSLNQEEATEEESQAEETANDKKGQGKKRFSSEEVEQWLENLYHYKVWHPSFSRLVVIFLGGILLVVSGWLTFQYFSSPKAVEPVFIKIEGIKQLGNLHLVKHHYESVIPITKDKLTRDNAIKSQKLQFLLIAPVEISGYIDISRMQIDTQSDSLIEIRIPPAEASKAYLDLSDTREFLIEGKMRLFGHYIEFVNHTEAYKDIVRGLNESKQKVRDRAIQNDILNQTEAKAELFLRNFVSNLGYRANIIVDSTLQNNGKIIFEKDEKSELEKVKAEFKQLQEKYNKLTKES